METFTQLISNQAFLNFLNTFGLAVLIVCYFIFVRDPKQARYWEKKYDELASSYKELSEAYKDLENTLRPETRCMSKEQALMLCKIALDRDLYKLFYKACKKIKGEDIDDMGIFLQDTIGDTNETWSKFRSPFPQVEYLSDLFGVYRSKGAQLREELEEILEAQREVDQKESLIWNKLFQNTVNMKNEFEEDIRKLTQGKSVEPSKQVA